jgi:hypothetical protein
VNFDEAGFRVGCAKGQWILVPKDVIEFYSLSPVVYTLRSRPPSQPA